MSFLQQSETKMYQFPLLIIPILIDLTYASNYKIINMTNFIFIFELVPALGIVKLSILTNFVRGKNFGKRFSSRSLFLTTRYLNNIIGMSCLQQSETKMYQFPLLILPILIDLTYASNYKIINMTNFVFIFELASALGIVKLSILMNFC